MTSPADPPISSTLPFEIWHYISRFLLDDHLCHLYSVNRAFFHISMSLRYCEASTRDLQKGIGFPGLYRILETPALSRYVRALTLTPTLLDFQAKTEEDKPPRKLTSRMRSLFQRSKRSGTHSTCEEVIWRIKDDIRALDQLTSLSIWWHTTASTPSHPFLDALNLGWVDLGRNITSLTLRDTTKAWQVLIPPSLHLERLENLSLEVHKYNHDADDIIFIQTLLVPFVRRHARTLTALKVAGWCTISFVEIYRGIELLPHLNKLRLEEKSDDHWQPYHTQSLHDFLQRHLGTLLDFSWAVTNLFGIFSYPDVGFKQAPLSVHLPKIRSLNLGFLGLFLLRNFPDVVTYVGRHTQTLTAFSLDGLSITPVEFHNLTDALASTQLKGLGISLKTLSATVFSILADRFQCLETLSLEYGSLSTETPGFEEENAGFITLGGIFERLKKRDQFIKDMQKLSLDNWPLGTLSLKWGSLNSCSWISRVELVGKVISESVPHIQFINGMYREDFVKLVVVPAVRCVQ